MDKNTDYDRFQLGQLIRIKANSIDICTRLHSPDLTQKRRDLDELKEHLDDWRSRRYPEGPDIAWALQRISKFDHWLNNRKVSFNPAGNPLHIDAEKLFILIRGRRSVRYWKKKPVPRELTRKIIEAGIWAPSAFNRLPWRFFVSETPEHLLADGDASNEGMMGSAPLKIFVAVDERLFFEKFSGPLDAGLAMQNMLLMAHALGLGTCLVYQGEYSDTEFLHQQYHVPSYCKVYCAILAGYPDEDPDPPMRMDIDEVTEFIE